VKLQSSTGAVEVDKRPPDCGKKLIELAERVTTSEVLSKQFAVKP
jgi:hypothetical protein